MKEKQNMRPESLMMSYGYDPALSEGAVKVPIFQTSTFVFRSAEEGKQFFEIARGVGGQVAGEEVGLIYSRMNNPNMEIFEHRLSLWDDCGDCAAFESGMAAITTVFLELLKPGDLLVYSTPLYGGTDHFIQSYLAKIGVHLLGFEAGQEFDALPGLVRASGHADRLAMIYVETPANPTNSLIDIARCKEVAGQFSKDGQEVYLAVDNTYMGPLWQKPIKHGADLSLYSATKYIGGHSDVIAGAVCGHTDLLKRIKKLRTYLGGMAGPWTSWLLTRSLETLKVRMEQQAVNARYIADFLKDHPKISRVYYLGFFEEGSRMQEIFTKQYLSAGAMLSFDVQGGEAAAFRFLNHLKLIKLAVSLGSTESLAEHPATMTHAGVDPEHRERMHITGDLVRLSVGLEHYEDLITDLTQALDAV